MEATRKFNHDFLTFEVRVKIKPDMTAEQIARTLDKAEREARRRHDNRKKGLL